MSLSKKKANALYDTVHNEIMNARIEVAKTLGDYGVGRMVDDILSKLSHKAPEAALKVFEPKIKP
jgi:hypothetical protein